MASTCVVTPAELDAFAREAVLSVASSSPLKVGTTAVAFEQALADEAWSVSAKDTPPVRRQLWAAFQAAALTLPTAAARLAGTSRKGAPATEEAPPVRVQVRGTAGRQIRRGVFTVGSGVHCDVQVAGDATVRPTQLLVVSLPGATVIIDAWSEGCSQVVGRRRDPGGDMVPVLGPWLSEAYVVEPHECVELQLGDRTTVTVEPLGTSATAVGSLAGRLSIDSISTGVGLSPTGSPRERSPHANSRCSWISGRDRSRSPRKSPMHAGPAAASPPVAPDACP